METKKHRNTAISSNDSRRPYAVTDGDRRLSHLAFSSSQIWQKDQ